MLLNPSLTDQQYVITDMAPEPYQHEEWTTDPVYCLVRYEYSISTLDSGKSAISRNDKTFTFAYSDDLEPLDETQTVVITATTFSIYGEQKAPLEDEEDFDLEFLSPCIDAEFVTLSPTTQMTLTPDSYSETDLVFTYNPFTVVPNFCEITVECNSVVGPSNVLGCQELVDGKLTWNFTRDNYHLDKLAPGDYVFTFDVSTGPAPELTKQFTVTVTL